MDLKSKAGKVGTVQKYLTIEMKATKSHPILEEGASSFCSPSVAYNLNKKGFAKPVEKETFDVAVKYLEESGTMPKFGTALPGVKKEVSESK